MNDPLRIIDEESRPGVTGGPAEVPFTPYDPKSGGTVFECALCGSKFTHGVQVCSSCPMGAACNLISCPNCGYGFPRNSSVVDFAKKTWGRLKRLRLSRSGARRET